MSTPFAYPNTDRTTLVASHIIALLKANQNGFSLPVRDVIYGKHGMVPNSPTIVVMAGVKDRTLRGVASPGGRTNNEMNVLIDVMAADVLGGEAAGRLALDTLAEDVEHYLHSYPNMDGLIIHGYVRRSDPGELFINNSAWRNVRMTFVGTSLTYLSPPAAPA